MGLPSLLQTCLAITGLLAELGYHHHACSAPHVSYSGTEWLVSEAAASAHGVVMLSGWLPLLCGAALACPRQQSLFENHAALSRVLD